MHKYLLHVASNSKGFHLFQGIYTPPLHSQTTRKVAYNKIQLHNKTPDKNLKTVTYREDKDHFKSSVLHPYEKINSVRAKQASQGREFQS